MPKIIKHLPFTKTLPDETEGSFDERGLDETHLRTVAYVYKGEIYAIHVIEVGKSSSITGGSVQDNAVTLDWYEPEDEKKQIFFVEAYNKLPKYIGAGEKKPDEEPEWYTKQNIETGEVGKEFKKFSASHKIMKSIVVYAKECANDSDYNLINHYGLDGVVGPIIGPYCLLRMELFGNDEDRLKKFKDSTSAKKSGGTGRAEFTTTQKDKLIKEKKLRKETEFLARKDCYYYRLRKSDGDKWVKLGDLEEKMEKLQTEKPDTEIYSITGTGGTYTVTKGKIMKETCEVNISKIKDEKGNNWASQKITAYKSDCCHAIRFYEVYVKALNEKVAIGFEESLLITGDRSEFGMVAPKNEIQIDHIHPAMWYGGEKDTTNGLKDPGGSNSFCNAVMISAELNNFKSNASVYKLESKKMQPKQQ